MDETLDIHELVAAAALALSAASVDQPSGRVSEVPTVRTVRYYASHGLLDPPSSHRGRKALYGPRHVQQLVAIKRQQARGASLVEIQERLLGADADELARLAGMPRLDASRSPPRRREEAFWARRPVEVEVAEPVPIAQAQPPLEGLLGGLRLDAHTVLMLEGARRALDEDDLAAIRAAAAPLLKLLRTRRIIDDRQPPTPPDAQERR